MHRLVVFWGLCAVLLFVPLPLGSVLEWAIFVFEAVTIVLFLIYLTGEFFNRKKVDHGMAAAESTQLFPSALKILLAVFIAVSIIQLLPLPSLIVKVVSPRAAAIYQGMARDGLAGWDARSWWTLSLAPAASLSKFVLILCYGLFAFLVLKCVRTRSQIEIFVLVVIGSALFQAFYGMAETFSGHEQIFGYSRRAFSGSVSGSFFNRNHFAGFMEMAFPLSLGYILAKARYFTMEKGLTLRRKILWFSQESLQWMLLLGLGTVFIGLGLVFSKSRSGIMIFLATVVLAGAAIATWRELTPEDADNGRDDNRDTRLKHRSPGGRRRRGIMRLIIAVVLLAALWLGIGPIIDRFAQMDLRREDRLVVFANTAEMIAGFPLAGTGKGTYLNAYAMYEKVDPGVKFSFAHNDYLEFAAENGVIGGGCLIAAGIGLAIFAAVRWRRRRNNFAKGVGLGALLGVVAILIHGFTDFNLQIPANAVYFAGLCALLLNVVGLRRGDGRSDAMRGENGLAERVGSLDGQNGGRSRSVVQNAEAVGVPPYASRRSEHNHKSLIFRRWRLVVGMAMAIAMFVVAAKDFLGFYYLGRYQATRSEAKNIQSAFPELEGILKNAQRSSRNPDLRRETARLYSEMARVENDAGNAEKRDTYCDRAAASYKEVLERNPIDASAQYEMGMVYLYYNYPLMTYVEKTKLYFRKALELHPADESLNLNILYLYLTWWNDLTSDERGYVGARLRAIRASDPRFMPQLEERWTKTFGSTESLARILGLN